MQVSASNNQFTTFGARIPTGTNAPATAQDGGIMRIRAGQPLPKGMDALLTPQDMKQLYEKGYLDVQRTFTTMESNEGLLTLTSKLAAALVGPSRSVGAIQIDPLFLEMIKDPNAEVGFGYTRVRNETLRVLPSPVADPAVQAPERPRTPPSVPPYVPPERRDPRTEPPRDVKPVDGVTPGRPQTGSVSFRGLFNHDSTDERNNSLIGHINNLGSQSFMSLTVRAGSNALAGGTYNNALTASRSSVFRDPITRSGNSDQVHRDFVQEHFGVDILGSRSSRAAHVPVGDRHRVVPSSEGPTGEGSSAVQPSDRFLRAATELFFRSTGKDGVQTSGGRPYPTQILQRNTDIITNVDQVFVPDEDGEGLTINREAQFDIDPDVRNVLTDIVKKQNPGISDAELEQEVRNLAVYAQSYLEHRKYEVEADITVNAETIGDAKNYLANTNRASLPPEMQKVYDEVEKAVAAFDTSKTAGAPAQEQTVADVSQNIRNLNQINVSDASIENVETVIGEQISRLPETGPGSPSTIEMPEFQKALDKDGNEVVIPRVQNGASLPQDMRPVAGDDRVMLSDWGTEKDAGPLQRHVLGNATTRPVSMDGAGDILASANKNVEGLTAMLENPPVSSRTLNEFEATIKGQIQQLEQEVTRLSQKPNLTPEENTQLASLRDGLSSLKADFAGLQDKLAAAKENARAADLAYKTAGGDEQFLNNVDNSLTGLRDYIAKEIIVNGTPRMTGAVADGKISDTEVADMQKFVDDSAQAMVNFLTSHEVPVGEGVKPQHRLESVTFESLTAGTPPKFDNQQASRIMETIDRLQFAQASVNVIPEGGLTAGLYERVHELGRRLDSFNETEVPKTAFREEARAAVDQLKNEFREQIQTFAQQQPEQFVQIMAGIYGLEGSEGNQAQHAALIHMARTGDLPFTSNIDFVDRDKLGGDGAYISGENGREPVILIARDLMDKPEAMQKVFFEEMFHHLEASVSAPLAEGILREAMGLEEGAALPDALPENASPEVTSAWNQLQRVRAGEEAPGDEGQVGATIMEARRNNPGATLEQLQRAGENVRMESSTIDPNVAAINRNDARFISPDRGTLQADIRDDQGNVIARSGSTIEFSTSATSPAATAPAATPPAQDGRATIRYTNEPGVNLNVASLNPHQSHVRGSTEVYNRGIGNDQSRRGETFNLSAPVRNNIQDPGVRSQIDGQIAQMHAQGRSPEEIHRAVQETLINQHGYSQEAAFNAVSLNTATSVGDEPNELKEGLKKLKDNAGDIIMSIGQSMQKLADMIKKMVAQLFGEVAMRLQQADPNKITAYDVVYGEGGWHGNDTDVSRGRPDDYGTLQFNQTADRTMNPNKAYSSNPNAKPNYLQDEQTVSGNESQLRQALKLDRDDPLPQTMPSDRELKDRRFSEGEINAAKRAWNAMHTPTTAAVGQASDTFRSPQYNRSLGWRPNT